MDAVENQSTVTPASTESSLGAEPTAYASPGALETEIAILQARWRGGNPVDPDLRAYCAERLERLRQVWRARPDAFAPAWLSLLKEISQALGSKPRTEQMALRTRQPPAEVGDPLEVLRTTSRL